MAIKKMKISLIMNQNSYAGREYLNNLKNNNIKIDVLSVGFFPEINTLENERCGNLWIPENESKLAKFHNFYRFKSLKSKELVNFLVCENYDLGIQGGTGIIDKSIINKYKLGILNFHPGLLPEYRGCSAPEWQIFENRKVYSTCHLIDENIDTGDIVEIKKLNLASSNYYEFRSSIYKETAKFLVDIIKKIIAQNGFKIKPYKQDEKKARYHSYIGKDKINFIKKTLLDNP